jgi:murein DD-endopeptidase MepM/ murein hydrolase activator NlpD
MRRSLGVLAVAGLLAACGNMVAPSMNSTYSSAPKNPNMGQVVNGSYVVAPGDTLAIISNRTNTPIRALIDNNGLQPPYNLRPGRELRISERQTYVVKSGDTLGALAKRFRVQQSALVELNELKPPYALRIGQTLTLPSAVEATQSAAAPLPSSTPSTPPAPEVDVVPSAANAGSVSATALPPPPGAKTAPKTLAPATAAPTSSASSTAKVQPLPPPVTVPAATAPKTVPTAKLPAGEPDLTAAEEAVEGAYEQQQGAKTTTPPPAPAPAAAKVAPVQEAAVVSAPSSSGFVWPAQGKVISKFGTTSDGLRNDGINISAPAGAPVMAAADGTVAYAGNQLRGFGNLVLIRHSNGLITAYAHNQSLLVQKGDKVKRGAVIARVGQTGNVAKPQLHFEIRKGEEPVDPMKYLGGGA